jgi:hypothetical protein
MNVKLAAAELASTGRPFPDVCRRKNLSVSDGKESGPTTVTYGYSHGRGQALPECAIVGGAPNGASVRMSM